AGGCGWCGADCGATGGACCEEAFCVGCGAWATGGCSGVSCRGCWVGCGCCRAGRLAPFGEPPSEVPEIRSSSGWLPSTWLNPASRRVAPPRICTVLLYTYVA